MAVINDVVRPGDVISSDLLNRIIALLNEHDAAIGGGGTGPGNLITGFSPPVEQNVGRTLTVFGQFDFPLGTNIVSIDGVPILPSQFLLGSGSDRIHFAIPTSIAVPAGGSRSVIVRVVNSHGTGERAYTLRPPIAAPPDPVITGLLDHGSGTLPLRSGQNARVTGQNFGSPATANLIRLVFNPGAGQTVIPPNVGESLVIDAALSVINPAPADSTIVVMMPPIGPELIPVVGQQAPAAIEIRAPGANNPDVEGANIRRMA